MMIIFHQISNTKIRREITPPLVVMMKIVMTLTILVKLIKIKVRMIIKVIKIGMKKKMMIKVKKIKKMIEFKVYSYLI